MFEDQLDRIPAEPPRSSALLPGLRLGSAISRRSLIIPLAFVALLALMPLFLMFEDPKARLTLGRSETTSGKVVHVAEGDACRGRGREITYTFVPLRGPEYHASRSVRSGSPYFNVRPGDSIPVKFLVSDPSVSTIAGEADTDPGLYFAFFFFPLFAVLIFGPLFLPRLGQVFRDRRLFRRGRVAHGTVLFVKQSVASTWPGWPGWCVSEVFVGFQLPSGAAAEARATCQNDWLLQHLQAGAPVHIAYLPDRPSRAVLLEAYVR